MTVCTCNMDDHGIYHDGTLKKARGKRKTKLARKAAATNPAEDAKNSSKGSSFPVHRHIEKSKHHHKDKPKVESQDLPSKPGREEEDWSGEMAEDKRGVEDRPDEEAVDYNICWVAVS
ncbi:hypothetical protein ZIOFF_010127 [Zingiber officinale]|uniref:Uncharacterized protein n=1 Tax=Zingiber officinale TaxID=94328 RepID=A0A8J5LP63_ZINOF|nr:hypothetical protein ZIOFF_010127 [Zingiber officinale]